MGVGSRGRRLAVTAAVVPLTVLGASSVVTPGEGERTIVRTPLLQLHGSETPARYASNSICDVPSP